MKTRMWAVAGLFALAACAPRSDAPESAARSGATDAAAPHLFENIGPVHRTISTRVPEAQRYFDQGLRLTYGFNHQAAGLAFAEAARLDPQCAMCWWGQALVLGPNINLPMPPDAAAPAWQALQQALARRQYASANEQALIDALSTRYAETAPADRSALDQAYAAAMRDVVARYPDDLDAATLFAESLMDLMPWAYWDAGHQPNTHTPEMMRTLERVLAANPQHTGAIHYYIHATEGSPNPRSAEPYADTLAELAPNAGHLVHMPAHTYIRIGRYHDATLNNLKATDADAHFLAYCRGSNGMYPLGYVPHNWHFIMITAGLEGSSAMALRASQQAAQRADLSQLDALTFMQQFLVAPLYTDVRFGRWDSILAQPQAPAQQAYPRAVWHFARGMAQARRGDLGDAQAQLDAIDALLARPELAATGLFDINAADKVIAVARPMLAGHIALAQGRAAEGLAALREAVAAEDALAYNEPPDWPLPVRPYLGAELLERGEAEAAARVYREDLVEFPGNGWSLYGLEQALRAQGDAAGADSAAQQLATAWQHADVKLAASRF